jgi:hypothetical protein
MSRYIAYMYLPFSYLLDKVQWPPCLLAVISLRLYFLLTFQKFIPRHVVDFVLYIIFCTPYFEVNIVGGNLKTAYQFLIHLWPVFNVCLEN